MTEKGLFGIDTIVPIFFALDTETMFSLRPNFLFVVLSSLVIVLLLSLLIQHPGNPIPERTSSAHGVTAPRPSVSEGEKTTLDYRGHSPVLIPRWSPLLRSLEGAPSELEAYQESDPFSWEEVQEDLSFMIEERFPDLRLSEREWHELTDAIKTIRSSMEEMRELERTTSNAGVLLSTRTALDRATETFVEITGMSAAEFILRGRPESGIDDEESDKDEIVQEYLSDFEP